MTPQKPWSGERSTHISLEDIGININVNLTSDEIRQIFQSLDPPDFLLVQKAVILKEAEIVDQAKHILAAAILEWLMRAAD